MYQCYIEKWPLDRRFTLVREVLFGIPALPYLAVVDDFGSLVRINYL